MLLRSCHVDVVVEWPLVIDIRINIILLSADQYTTCEFNCENNLIKSPSIYNRKSDVTDSSQSFLYLFWWMGKGSM